MKIEAEELTVNGDIVDGCKIVTGGYRCGRSYAVKAIANAVETLQNGGTTEEASQLFDGLPEAILRLVVATINSAATGNPFKVLCVIAEIVGGQLKLKRGGE